jgi:hypothetical protein
MCLPAVDPAQEAASALSLEKPAARKACAGGGARERQRVGAPARHAAPGVEVTEP